MLRTIYFICVMCIHRQDIYIKSVDIEDGKLAYLSENPRKHIHLKKISLIIDYRNHLHKIHTKMLIFYA